MSEPPISVSGQRAEHATFAQRLRAEWTRFRASRGSVLGIVASVLAMWLLGGLSLAADVRSCSSGGVEVACESAPVGPSGEAVSDRFYFVHQTLTGDGSITARLTAMTGLIKEPPPP